MANFKILSIKVLEPQEEFLKWNYEQLIEAYHDPIPEDIALRVSRYKNIHKILEPGTEYRFQEIDGALPEDFFQVKKDYEENERVIDLSVCAIVGQNGSGKRRKRRRDN